VANDPSKLADDAAAPGHECQPETVDIPLSIAAIFDLPVPARQIAAQARFLNEAFTPPVGFPDEEEELPPPPEEPPPPPPPPPVIIIDNTVEVIPVRPPKDPFPFKGLLRRLRAQVTDAKGRPPRRAKRGTRFTTIEVRGDFGKPVSIVRLTFYKRAASRTGARRSGLEAIAQFKPFTVKRGPAKLRLRVPKQFRPVAIGLVVQQVRKVGSATATDGDALEKLKPVGKPRGGIARLAGARLLHRRKGGGR
jgi:hypothetical protein